jgi:hypothetical protein
VHVIDVFEDLLLEDSVRLFLVREDLVDGAVGGEVTLLFLAWVLAAVVAVDGVWARDEFPDCLDLSIHYILTP